jgi:murein DD-endopeptidase MepM/ murein hydrolase activator NlpD
MKIHIVRPGDTLWGLAQKYNTPIERLREANPALGETEELSPGLKIRVPTGRIPITSAHSAKSRESVHSSGNRVPEEKKEDCEKIPPSFHPVFVENHFDDLPKPPTVPQMPSQKSGWESVSSWESSIFSDEGELQGYSEMSGYTYPLFTYGYWPYFPYEPIPTYPSAYPNIQGVPYGYANPPYPFVDPTAYAKTWQPPGVVPESIFQGSQPPSEWPVTESSSSEG